MGRPAWALAVAIAGLAIGLAVIGAVGEASAQSSGVCDRTAQVRDAIVEASGAASCSDVTELHHLREVTSLDLSSQGITGLASGDFEGLVRVKTLDLSGNSLTELPAGVFDPLYLLHTLRLDDNQLTSLPDGIFDRLWLLEELTLSGNTGLTVADDLFGEFAELAGFQVNGTMPDNSGTYPRIQRFLDANTVASPEEFIEALPDLYKQRFSWVYKSEALAQDHVSFDHPRFVSWGADGRYIFAWNTDPDAPEDLLEVIEFLRQNDDDWTAGVIDFSGDTPQISEPTSCQVCHGSLNKPLWGAFGAWDGTEIPHRRAGEISEDIKAAMRAVLASADSRIDSLDLDGSVFPTENPEERYLRLPGNYAEIWAVEEAGVIFSLRHTEVLFQRLKEREDYRRRAEEAVCDADPYSARERALETFSENDHNPAVLVSTGEVIQKVDGLDGLARSPDYHYNTMGELGGALIFLMVADLWEREPVVRHLYRTTSNEDTVIKKRRWMSKGLLYHGAGDATAEDELIWKLRQHFGNGNRASLSARAYQNFKLQGFGMLGAFFFDGHLEAMAPRVCDALRTSKPTGLTAALDEGNATLSWQAPQYDTESLTGYRILRGVGGGPLTPYVADTGTTNTTWVDNGPGAGEYTYAVQAIYGDHYSSRASNEAELDISLDITLAATTGDQSVHLTWDLPVTGYIYDMDLERLDVEGQVVWSTTVASDQDGDVTTTWTQSDHHFLVAGTTYRYRLKLDTENYGVIYSDVLEVTTQSDPPLAPTGLSATATHDTVSLSWTMPEQPAWVDGPVDLTVMRTRSGGETLRVGSVPWQQGVTEYSFTDAGLWAGQTHRYFIRTLMGGRYHYSAEVSITTAVQPEDPDGTREGAIVLDTVAAAASLQKLSGYSQNRNGGDRVDYYTFTTTARHQLTFGVWRIRGEGNDGVYRGVSLEDAQGNTIVEASAPPDGGTGESLETAIGPGTYYVRVEAMDDAPFSYFVLFGLEPPPLTGFTLLDASTQTVLATLTDGAVVELADPDGGSYAIRVLVHADASIGRVLLQLSGAKTVSQTENHSPYSLYGDDGENALHGEALPEGSYVLRATAFSSRLGGRQLAEPFQVSFTVRGPNSPPAFGSATFGFSVAEDAATGAAVGSVSATDADDDTLTYTITAGNEDGAFAIDGGTGAITTAGALDHETTPSYTLTVQADDGNGGTDTATVNVAVTDVDENSAPSFGSATFGFSVAEDAATGAAVGNVSATDADDDTLTYTITAGNEDGAFAIDGGTGAITTAGALDYETDAAYTLTVQADDGNGGTANAAVYITLTNVVEPSEGPLSGFTLVDASNQSALARLGGGSDVALADPANGSYAIRVDLADGETVGSVRPALSGAKSVGPRTENLAPYSLYGDGGADALDGEPLPAGSYTLTATAYAESGLGGDELGTLEVSFTITAGN